ncbi:MAG: hypothetical protein Q6353_012490 [Candidatus Sigynarchaeum springense]
MISYFRNYERWSPMHHDPPNPLLETIWRVIVALFPGQLRIKDHHVRARNRRAWGVITIAASMLFLVTVEFTITTRRSSFYDEKAYFFDPGTDMSPSDIWNPMPASERKEAYLNGSITSTSFAAQIARLFRGIAPYEPSIVNVAKRYEDRTYTSEFDLTLLLRMVYLNKGVSLLSPATLATIKQGLLNFNYWFTEPQLLPTKDQIMYTENHMIQMHACELLAGQLYPNETFANSGMTGTQHITHARSMIYDWLDWKANIGFTETSLTYFTIDIPALVNLVDFSEDSIISKRSAMVLDLIAFDLANHFFNGSYATANGRLYNRDRVGTPSDTPDRDDIAEATWIMTGLGYHATSSKTNGDCLSLATSNAYVTPPVIEMVANATRLSHEHRDRNGIYIEEANKFGIGHGEDDLMFWWHMSAPVSGPVIETSFKVIEKYHLNPENILGPQLLIDFIKFNAGLHGVPVGTYASKIYQLTRGVALEAQNRYVYRTPHYQLAAMQDSQKGTNCMQEHVWQASLGGFANVWTNWDGFLSFKGGKFIGGWKPRVTVYRNIGVIQYDRATLPLELELFLLTYDYFTHVENDSGSLYPPIHAYFPRWAFDEVDAIVAAGANAGTGMDAVAGNPGTWLFGRKGDAYIALYSKESSEWKSDIEFAVKAARKNAYIVELGDADESGTFAKFKEQISRAKVDVRSTPMGYDVKYVSPSRGLVTVDWDAPMVVNGMIVNLGPYDRFDNQYCHQPFGTRRTIITCGNQSLVLDFDTLERTFNATV